MEMEREEDQRQRQETRSVIPDPLLTQAQAQTQPQNRSLTVELLGMETISDLRRGRSFSAVDASDYAAMNLLDNSRGRVASLELRRAISEESSDRTHSNANDSRKGAATANLAKFKEEQDLRIQTENLIQRSTKKSDSSESSNFTTPGTDTSSTGATPRVPPSSTGKKRRRRTAAQIDRKYSCTHPGCTKAYGSEGSLTQHQRLKHRQPTMEKTTPSQLKGMFLPLHRPNQPPSSLNATKNITIRPAGTGVDSSPGISSATTTGLTPPFSPYDMNTGLPQNDSTSSSFFVASNFSENTAVQQRQNLRLRSNSMPVSFSDVPATVATVNPPIVSRPQSTRRPRAMTMTKTRRTKSRSKSESVLKVPPPPSAVGSTMSVVSDVTTISESGPISSGGSSSVISESHPMTLGASKLTSVLKSEVSSSSSSSCSSFQEYKSVLENSSSSFNWAPQPTSMVIGMPESEPISSPMNTPEDDIDSEILSVLANDTGNDNESSSAIAEGGLRATSSNSSRMEGTTDYKWAGSQPLMINCRKSTSTESPEPYQHEPMQASSAPVASAFDPILWNSMSIHPEQQQRQHRSSGSDVFSGTYDHDWLMSNDAVCLTNHLERMSMVPSNEVGFSDGPPTENNMGLLDPFPAIPMDDFGLDAPEEVEMELIDSNEPAANSFWSADVCNNNRKGTPASSTFSWTKDGAVYSNFVPKDGQILDNKPSASMAMSTPEEQNHYKPDSRASEFEHSNQLEGLDEVLWGGTCSSFASNQQDL